ncbi:MAG: hypothetical protein B6D77_03465 [gamma proteobacterium symbiont of Ctena orbiculata]|nr:MAG: hypothetical protein B6D77_03465 [gamma proteobacterium symbiont of Ctena orbiculata]
MTFAGGDITPKHTVLDIAILHTDDQAMATFSDAADGFPQGEISAIFSPDFTQGGEKDITVGIL